MFQEEQGQQAANTFEGSDEGGSEGRWMGQLGQWFPEQYGGAVRLHLGYCREVAPRKGGSGDTESRWLSQAVGLKGRGSIRS